MYDNQLVKVIYIFYELSRIQDIFVINIEDMEG